MLARVGRFMSIGGASGRAAALVAPYASAAAFSFVDNSAMIKDASTPANNFIGAPFGKLSLIRATSATYINSSGVITLATSGTPRIDYNPTTLEVRGFLCEPARTNLLLNSLINGTSLTTQSPTVAAAAHTLSFYGTGSITLSGAHTATLNGAGAYPARAALTFTPSAGALTCTVSGSVQYAQLEAGDWATSFIPTAGATVARNSDNCSVLTSAIPYSGTAYSIFARVALVGGTAVGSGARTWASLIVSSSNRVIVYNAGGVPSIYLDSGGVNQVFSSNAAAGDSVFFKHAVAASANDFATVKDGGAAVTDAAGAMPVGTPVVMGIGSYDGSASHLGGWIQDILYVPQRLSNAALQALTV